METSAGDYTEKPKSSWAFERKEKAFLILVNQTLDRMNDQREIRCPGSIKRNREISNA